MNTDTGEIKNWDKILEMLGKVGNPSVWRELKNCPLEECEYFHREVDGKMFCHAPRKIWEEKKCFGEGVK